MSKSGYSEKISVWFDSSTMFSMLLAVSVAAVVGILVGSYFAPKNFGYHDGQRVLEVLCVVLGTLSLIQNLWRGTPAMVRIGKPVSGLWVMFLIIGFFSSLSAYSPRHALYEWSSLGLLLVLAWIIANEVARNPVQQLDRMLLVLGLGCALYVFKVALVYIFVLQSGTQPEMSEFIIGFNNYRFFNHVQTITLPLLGLLTLRSMQRGPAADRLARYGWGLLSLWWMLLFVSAGRGTFMGVLAGMVAVIFWRRRQALPWCRVMLLSAMAGLAAYAVFFLLVPVLMGLQPFGFLNGVVERSIENPGSSRGALWQRAGEMILSHPLLGAGPLHFAHYGRDINNGAHPHNWLLQIGAEWGVPALIVLCAVIFMSFRRLLGSATLIAAADLPNQAVLTAWLATGVAVVVDGLVSGLIVMPSSQLWIVVYMGCAWGWVSSFSRHGGHEKPVISLRIRTGLGLLALSMLFFIGNGLWPEIIDLPGYKKIQTQLHPEMDFAPRIWSLGYF